MVVAYLRVEQCVTLRAVDMNNFECIGKNMESTTLTTGQSRMVCIGYHFDMVDDLVRHCGGSGWSTTAIIYYANIALRLKELERSLSEVKVSQFDPRRGEGNSMIISNVILLIVSLVMVLHCLLRG